MELVGIAPAFEFMVEVIAGAAAVVLAFSNFVIVQEEVSFGGLYVHRTGYCGGSGLGDWKGFGPGTGLACGIAIDLL